MFIHDEDSGFSTDYEGRCGNCQETMNEKDKYCKFCGTKKGEGKFKPYKNDILCVYGPPMTMKFCCSDCGEKWITFALGGVKSKYCPNCGSKNLSYINRKIKNFGSHIGTIADDYEEGDVLLSEEEVAKVLSIRPSEKDINNNLLQELLNKNGFPEISKAEEEIELTEKEAERLDLAELILKLKGDNPFEINETKNLYCPRCNSKLLAAIGWWNEEEPSKVEYMKVTGKELYYNSNRVFHDEYTKDYHCLQCGFEFK